MADCWFTWCAGIVICGLFTVVLVSLWLTLTNVVVVYLVAGCCFSFLGLGWVDCVLLGLWVFDVFCLFCGFCTVYGGVLAVLTGV